jgi:hypothetical protein
MNILPEERRLLRLLREKLVQRRETVEGIELQLSWESGRLRELLDERGRLLLGELLEVLPLLGSSPEHFFASAYGLDTSEEFFETASMEAAERDVVPLEQKILDRRFDDSRRVIEEAIVRRGNWKREREEL